MSKELENDTMNVTIEEVEESAALETTTVIGNDLVRLLAKIAARNDVKNQKRRPLYNLLGVFVLAMVVWMFYTYYIAKTQTNRGPLMMLILLAMDVSLFWYVNQPIEQFMEKRMKPFLGQQWHYTVDDEGVGLVLNQQEGRFAWNEIRGWWLEDGYYLMDVSGQAIAIRQDNLTAEEEEQLKSLLYIYLGEALPIESHDYEADHKANKKARKQKLLEKSKRK